MIKSVATVVCSLLAFSFNASANGVLVDGKPFASLKSAISSIKDGSRVYLEAGVYTEGAYIKASNIAILGEPGVVFDGALADGKAALVLTGDNVEVESVECANITAPAGNGACIRFEGANLVARDIHVHDCESGIMTASDAGKVEVSYSRFERLGNRNGYAHALYIKADELFFRYSSILSTKLQGSGIKSRSKKVIVENSIIATLDGVDSRLIDMANYGELIVRDSILQQGNNSSNSQLIAYGLEKKVKQEFEINKIVIKDNLIFFDRRQANVLVRSRLEDERIISGNVFVGDFNNPNEFVEGNLWYVSRAKAHVTSAPYLPQIHEKQIVMDRIRIIGEAQND
jgi:tetrahydromethanopterin S-methyltransferase subunit F